MPQPSPYQPSFSFTGYQSTNPDRPLPGPRHDTEYINIAQSLGETQSALADLRRDDGKLQNGIVTAESLDPGMALGILPPEPWVTGQDYKPPESVWQGNILYQCTLAHTSTTFSADLDAGYWLPVVDFNVPIDAAEAWADQAAASAADAAASAAGVHADAVTASNAAASATASKNAAATSAGNALTSENNALASKNAAAASATAADGSKTAAANSAAAALASQNAAAGSATNASTSASDALASKNAAKTSETNAGVSAGQAATSATNAASSANAAGASQTAAANSATAASGSATNAATSASAALASKNAAAISEANAAASAALYPDAPSDGQSYGRKNAVWSQVADPSLMVKKAGDTMTGDLTIAKATPSLVMDKAAAGQACVLAGRKGGLQRWDLHFGNVTAESGSNAGSDLALNRYSDTGTYLDTPLGISRATGNVTMPGKVALNGAAIPANNRNGMFVSSDLALVGQGALLHNGYWDTVSAGYKSYGTGWVGAEFFNTTTGSLAFSRSAGSIAAGALSPLTTFLLFDPTSGATFAGQVNFANYLISTTATALMATTGAGTCYMRPNGVGSATGQMYVDSGGNLVAAGNVSAYSDPRLKDEVAPITDALAIIDALDGVRFTWNNRSTLVGEPGKRDIGLLADQVEAVLPEIVGLSVPDAGNDGERWQTVAYGKLVPVLVEAIKELQTRIGQLEARI